jgi:hypothetical protein
VHVEYLSVTNAARRQQHNENNHQKKKVWYFAIKAISTICWHRMETITKRASFWNHLGKQKENKAYVFWNHLGKQKENKAYVFGTIWASR